VNETFSLNKFTITTTASTGNAASRT
jgi:hypothetical protein